MNSRLRPRNGRPRISVVIIARNEAGWLPETIDSFRSTLPEGSQIVVVDDGSQDGGADFLRKRGRKALLVRTPGLGEAKARNLGMRHATGDIIVCADAHLRLPPDWWAPMTELLEDPKVGAVSASISMMGHTSRRGCGLEISDAELTARWLKKRSDQPYPVPLLPGGFLAMCRETYAAIGGFDEAMPQLGALDMELSIRMWLLGYELWVVPEVVVAHRFKSGRNPSKRRCAVFMHNLLRMAFVHFNGPRITRVVEALHQFEGFPEGLAMTMESDVAARRSELYARRVRDSEWYFERFNNRW